MASVDTRVAGWVEIVADLLKEPLTSFPVDLVNRHLDDTFEAEAVAYNYREPDGKSWQQVFTSADRLFAGLELPEALALSQRVLNERGLLNHHPLVRWFAATGNPAAQSWGRVPSAIATSARSAELIERMATYDLLVQMSIPVHLDGVEHAAFVLGRGGKEDFSQEDVAVARRVQPALSALYRQCVVLGGHPLGILAEPLRGCVLTGRELAVLRLLADGLTASAIGRRLAASPRTIHKHLENAYRKLGVQDRVTAVRMAEAMGWVPPATPVELPSKARSALESRRLGYAFKN
jgi:DNA-binding CsgD family transcriptional regulator